MNEAKSPAALPSLSRRLFMLGAAAATLTPAAGHADHDPEQARLGMDALNDPCWPIFHIATHKASGDTRDGKRTMTSFAVFAGGPDLFGAQTPSLVVTHIRFDGKAPKVFVHTVLNASSWEPLPPAQAGDPDHDADALMSTSLRLQMLDWNRITKDFFANDDLLGLDQPVLLERIGTAELTEGELATVRAVARQSVSALGGRKPVCSASHAMFRP